MEDRLSWMGQHRDVWCHNASKRRTRVVGLPWWQKPKVWIITGAVVVLVAGGVSIAYVEYGLMHSNTSTPAWSPPALEPPLQPLLPLAPPSTPPPPRAPDRQPVLVAFSGGGFRAMVGSMAVARGLAGIGRWPEVTHVASVSGGSWFSSQLAFGNAFHAAILNTSAPMTDVLERWAHAYALRLVRESFVPPQPLGGKCHFFDVSLDKLAEKFMSSVQVLSSDWEPFVATILEDNVDGGPADTTYARARTGWASGTLIQGTTLPPDTYLSSSADSDTLQSYDLLVNGSSIASPASPLGYALPLSFSADAAGGREWHHTVSALALAPAASASTSAPASASMLGGVPVPLPADPTIATISAASSAFGGAASSLTMISQLIEHQIPTWLHSVTRDLPQCLGDAGLIGLGVPTDGSDATAAFPKSCRSRTSVKQVLGRTEVEALVFHFL